MYRKARLYVLCCALLTALALIASGCGGNGASNAGSGSGQTAAGGDSAAAGGDSGQAGQSGQSGASGTAAGDGDGEAFDLNETGRPGMYDVISRFETIAYRMVSTSDELDWASIHISFLGTGDHESGPVDQYLITISGPDMEFGDELLEMWFAQDGRLVAVRDAYDNEGELVTEPFVLALTEAHGGWMILPFQSVGMMVGDPDAEDEVVITSRTFSIDTVLDQRVPVAIVTGSAMDDSGEFQPFTMRIAQIAGLPFVLEVQGGTDPMVFTPTIIELR